MLGVSRQRVYQLANDDPGFPQPAVRLAAGPVWERGVIEAWAKCTGRSLVEGEA